MSISLHQQTIRSHKKRIEKVYILVMGLTGAGKSTFISILTQNEDIPIGDAAEMDGVTQEVQDYILYIEGSVVYEVHLIDSPGFDDGCLIDSEVLSKIAQFVNTIYRLKHHLAGVLYLHDMTKARMGGSGQRNLRMLEEMIGMEQWDNCTLVTTKWRCSNLEDEEKREATLMREDKFFGTMLHKAGKAKIERFDPRDKTRALEIIKPFLGNKFVLRISQQMADPDGPKLALGETSAGKVIVDDLQKLAAAKQSLVKVKAALEILAQKYDERVFEEFKGKRKRLQRKMAMQRAGRWVIRTTIVGGAIAATVLTLGPGASAFALETAYEKVASVQKKSEREAQIQLEQEFRQKSADGFKLMQKSSSWLWDKSVKNLRDLDDDRFDLASGSDVELRRSVQKGVTVGFAADDEANINKKDKYFLNLLADAESETTTESEEDMEKR